MGTLKVNNITTESGSTITLGESGKTVAIASGATTSGMGRTGTVDWQTTPKTATFTAVSGEGYFCNTSGGAFEVDLPAGSAGAIVSVQDYNNTFDNNNLTIDPNGSEKINGGDAGFPLTLSTEGQGITLVYIDSTVGWRSVHSDDFSQVPQNPVYMAASGGTTVNSPCGDYKIHTFTSPGTFTVSAVGNNAGSDTVEVLGVAAGGGGGGCNGGGGGAGAVASNSAVTLTATGYPITIGAGGTAGPSGGGDGSTGTAITFFSNTIRAGGGGKGADSPGSMGGTFSNGGGGAGVADSVPYAQASYKYCGVAHPTISGYTIGAGNNGGAGRNSSTPPNPGPGNLAGGGAGSGAVGVSAPSPTQAGNGGVGTLNAINGSSLYWGGGGGGGTNNGTAGDGGNGGGGGGGGAPGAGNGGSGGAGLNAGSAGANGPPSNGGAGGSGGDNTGGGGGGAGRCSASNGGTGGSGIVIIKYKFQN